MTAPCRPVWRRPSHRAAGFTLVELLVATALTLLLMGVAVNGFGLLTGSIGDNQAVIETSGRLRSAQNRLQLDLRYATARMTPPLDPAQELGYFEIIEGPGPWTAAYPVGAEPITDLGQPDSSVGDIDDVLMFTCRSYGEPFTGLNNGVVSQSRVAEVAWFMRGNKLYRRVLLVIPGQTINAGSGNFYNQSDVSVRQRGGSSESELAHQSMNAHLVPNSLGDLTKRENRFVHQPLLFPHDVRYWGQLGLPLIHETTHPNFPFPILNGSPSPGTWVTVPGTPPAYQAQRDFWENPMLPFPGIVPKNDPSGAPPDGIAAFTLPAPPRVTEDVILDNVIGFDVKVWDPGAPVFEIGGQPVLPTDAAYKERLASGATPVSRGAFVDLFYSRGTGAALNADNIPTAGVYQGSYFAGPGHPRSQLVAAPQDTMPANYCTWSTHYEHDGIDQNGDGIVDSATNGIDDNNQGGVDDITEHETMPPYPVPLRAIQIKIRVFEPSSRQVREVTVVQDFVR